MMPIENIQELRSDGAWNINFLFAHSLHTALQVEPNGAINFYDAGFWQCSEAVGLSQVSKMIRQLSGQISAHCSSSKIRNTHLSLFHPDQGPHTVQCSSRLDYNRSLRSGILYLLEFKPLDLLIETLDCVPSNS